MDKVYILTEKKKIVYSDYLMRSAALSRGVRYLKFIDCAFFGSKKVNYHLLIFLVCLCDGHSTSGFADPTGGSTPLDASRRHTLLCPALLG